MSFLKLPTARRTLLGFLSALALFLWAAPAHAQDDEDKEIDNGGRRSPSSRSSTVDTLVQDNRRIDRTSRSTRRSRNSEEPAAQQQGESEESQMARARGAPPQTLTGGSARAAAPRATSGGNDSLHIDPKMAVLYFTPTTVSVMEDEQFETTLRLSNPGGQTFDRLNVELLYNAAAIEPLGYQAEQAGRSAERIDLKTNAETGRMGLEMVFSRERQDQLASLVTIQWRARREVRATQVVFLSRDEARTFVGLPAGGSILGNTERDAPGVIQTSVRVAPNFSLTPVEGSSALPYVDLGQSAVAPIGGVNLTLRPRQSTASVNGLVDVDVVVSNPDSARVDSIRLFIRFDPDALQVLDTHSGNWIERDINIWDGHAHEMFPWDIHIANEANNSLGRITYAMGLVEEMPLPSGVLATIRFRVKSPAGSLPIAFDPERTSVRLLGEDQLGDPLAEGDGLRDTVVEVRDPSHDLPVVTGARRGPPIS